MSEVSAPVVEVATARRSRSASARSLRGQACSSSSALLAYLIVLPLVRLQVLAFGARRRAYSEAFGDAGDLEDVSGRRWSWRSARSRSPSCSARRSRGPRRTLSPRLRFLRILPILPIVVPAIASVLGWSFLFSPHPGYLNALLRHLPWWHHLYEGPVDIYTLPWIIIITGLALTSFIYLFVSAGFENINGELLEAAQVSGSSPAGVFFRVTLPLLRPSLIYGARRRAAARRSDSSPRRCSSARTTTSPC